MSDQTPQKPPQPKEKVREPSVEGVAALMLCVGVPEDRIPEVWSALSWSVMANNPAEAVKIVRHAWSLVEQSLAFPTKPEHLEDGHGESALAQDRANILDGLDPEPELDPDNDFDSESEADVDEK